MQHITNAQKKRMEARRISYSPEAEHFYPVSELFYQTVPGSGFFMFMKRESRNHLVNLVVYANETVGLCREAYVQYLIEPSEFNRNRLREKYELVPEHQRMYLGRTTSGKYNMRQGGIAAL